MAQTIKAKEKAPERVNILNYQAKASLAAAFLAFMGTTSAVTDTGTGITMQSLLGTNFIAEGFIALALTVAVCIGISRDLRRAATLLLPVNWLVSAIGFPTGIFMWALVPISGVALFKDSIVTNKITQIGGWTAEQGTTAAGGAARAVFNQSTGMEWKGLGKTTENLSNRAISSAKQKGWGNTLLGTPKEKENEMWNRIRLEANAGRTDIPRNTIERGEFIYDARDRAARSIGTMGRLTEGAKPRFRYTPDGRIVGSIFGKHPTPQKATTQENIVQNIINAATSKPKQTQKKATNNTNYRHPGWDLGDGKSYITKEPTLPFGRYWKKKK